MIVDGRDVREVIGETAEAFLIEGYHCDYLADCLRTGDQADPDWEPHVGERSQARAAAERLRDAIVAAVGDPVLIVGQKLVQVRQVFDPEDMGRSLWEVVP